MMIAIPRTQDVEVSLEDFYEHVRYKDVPYYRRGTVVEYKGDYGAIAVGCIVSIEERAGGIVYAIRRATSTGSELGTVSHKDILRVVYEAGDKS